MPKVYKRIYLDYAATTPMDAEVEKAIEPFFGVNFGNPSSLYKSGLAAKAELEKARQTIAALIGANRSEIIFTAGGSESVNLAILGVGRAQKNKSHFITTEIEHHCVLNSFKALTREGHKTTFVSVDSNGLIKLDELKKAVKPETVLISVMYANNEIGTIEPIAEIGKWVKKLNQERLQKKLPVILFHTDACQAAGVLDLDVNLLGVDLMTVNGSKIYGPKQSGFLFAKHGIMLEPLVYGGGQESGFRSGTENVAFAIGLAKALSLAQASKTKQREDLLALSKYLIDKIKKYIPDVLLNGYEEFELKNDNNKNTNLIRLPNNINLMFKGVEGEALMLYLDAYGFEVSTASACSTGDPNEPSHVLLAIGRSKQEAQSSIRISLGKYTKLSELKRLVVILPNLISKLRKVTTQ